MIDEEDEGSPVQEYSYLWSGRVDRVGRDLLIPWLDAEYREAGSVWVSTQKAAELASAILVHLPGGSSFIDDLMRQSLVGRIPDEYLDKAVACTTAASLLAIEHALALADKAREVRTKAARPRRTGHVNDVVPSAEHEGML